MLLWKRSLPTKRHVNFPEMNNNDSITWREMLSSTSDIVGDRIVAKWLCEHAAGVNSTEWLDILDEDVTERCGLHLDAMMRRYLAGEPLQYVLGRWAFRHLDLLVDTRVLIPRPETEQLVDLVIDFLHEHTPQGGDPLTAVDLGTGSGAIGLSLLTEMPLGTVEVWLTDASQDAIDVAQANIAGIGRAGMYGHIALGGWYEALPRSIQNKVDVVVSNPPYIADNDPDIENIVRTWEPSSALFAGTDGLSDIRVIVANARKWLRSGGLLAIEIGHRQSDEVVSLFEIAGFNKIQKHADATGISRFVTAVA